MATFTACIMLALVALLAASSSPAAAVNSDGCQQRQISSCQRYIRDSSRCELTEGAGWREEFPRCCDELEQISEECRCDAVRQALQEVQEVGSVQGREMGEMLRTAESLPNLCRISPQHCHNIRDGAEALLF